MSKPTHTVKLRDGKAPAENVTDADLASLKKTFGARFSEFDVTPLAEDAPKPAPAPKPEKSKPEGEPGK